MERCQTLLDALRPKQRRFVECYIENGGNGTQAAKDAGYQCVSDKSFAQVSIDNLGKRRIRECLDAYRANLERKTQQKVLYTREMAIAEYDKAIEIAVERKQASAYCTAIVGKVALCGLAIKEQENPADSKPMTRQELEQALAELDELEREANAIQMQVNRRVG